MVPQSKYKYKGKLMLNKANIRKHIDTARPLFAKVQKLYHRLPETLCQCDTPGSCCTTMPEMTVVEALQWLDVVMTMSPEKKLAILQNFLAFYLSTPLLRSDCPFLINDGCTNYYFRTFACRAYGLWSVSVGKQRTTENRYNRRETVKAWQQMGVNLSVEKVMYEMDYCDRVVQKKTQTMDDKGLFTELQELYKMSSSLPLLQKQFEEEFHSDFSYLVSCLLFPARKVLLGKLAVIKELHEKGTNSRLQKFLSKVTVDSL